MTSEQKNICRIISYQFYDHQLNIKTRCGNCVLAPYIFKIIVCLFHWLKRALQYSPAVSSLNLFAIKFNFYVYQNVYLNRYFTRQKYCEVSTWFFKIFGDWCKCEKSVVLKTTYFPESSNDLICNCDKSLHQMQFDGNWTNLSLPISNAGLQKSLRKSTKYALKTR